MPDDGVTTVRPSRLACYVLASFPRSLYTSVYIVRFTATRLPCQLATNDLRAWSAPPAVSEIVDASTRAARDTVRMTRVQRKTASIERRANCQLKRHRCTSLHCDAGRAVTRLCG